MRTFLFSILLTSAITAECQAQVFTTLVDFDGVHGAAPAGTLVEGMNLRLYGSTQYGGNQNAGIIFAVSPSASQPDFETLLNMKGSTGAYPQGSITTAGTLMFYGAASAGGANQAGSVFSVSYQNPAALTIIHSFDFTDGSTPVGGLVQGFDGRFYGTTKQGGAQHDGTIFAIAADGTFNTLHIFRGSDGKVPLVAPIQGSDGLLYGTTSQGGQYGYGAVYSISRSGVFTTLHQFTAGSDGGCPAGGLVEGFDGNFYGTTECGAEENGTVFQITSSGSFSTLHTFYGYPDGGSPDALILGSDGNFYGTTLIGGGEIDFSFGSIFRVTPGGDFTTLHTFQNVDGATPLAGVSQHTNGAFYGTTSAGGTSGNGTAYQLITGLPKFVQCTPSFGAAGATIIVIGEQLGTTTSVTFNGVPAEFAIYPLSHSPAIAAMVPAGATTGMIQVTTANGTFSSNIAFHVLP